MLELSAEFNKAFKKLSKKVRTKVEERLEIFLADEYSPILNNHKLQGEYDGCRSISITGDLRIIYYEKSKRVYKLVTIGTHSQLY